MLNSTLKQNMFCFFLGVAIALIAIVTLGYTMAIAAPVGLFEWFKSHGSLEAGLFLWGSTVVAGLGTGLPAFLVLLVAFRLAVAPTIRSVLFFLVGALLTAHVLVPLAYGTPLSAALSRPWRAYGFELSLIVGTLVALLMARWLWHDRAIKGARVVPN